MLKVVLIALKTNTGKDGYIVEAITKLNEAVAGSGSGSESTGLGGVKSAIISARNTLNKTLKEGLFSTTDPKGNVADTINAAVGVMHSWFNKFAPTNTELGTDTETSFANYFELILARMDLPFTITVPQHASGTKSAKRGYALVGERVLNL